MPAQLLTIMYIAEYREKTSSDFLVGTAIGYTRLEEENDSFQKFNITVFYPTDVSKPCYVPKLKAGQVMSIANSKFSIASNNEIDVSFCSFNFYPLFLLCFAIYFANLIN